VNQDKVTKSSLSRSAIILVNGEVIFVVKSKQSRQVMASN